MLQSISWPFCAQLRRAECQKERRKKSRKRLNIGPGNEAEQSHELKSISVTHVEWVAAVPHAVRDLKMQGGRGSAVFEATPTDARLLMLINMLFAATVWCIST